MFPMIEDRPVPHTCRERARRVVIAALFIALLIAAIFMAAGCDASGQFDRAQAQEQLANAQQVVAQGEAAIEQLQSQLADLETELAATPESPERDRMLDRIAKVRGKLTTMRPVVDAAEQFAERLEAKLANAQDGVEAVGAAIETGVNTAAPFLPPPWNILVPGLTGIVLGIGSQIHRAIKARNDAESVARAVGAAARAGGGVLNFNEDDTREALSAAMTDSAKALVKRAGATVRRATTPTNTPSTPAGG